jgi:hypothetical protein
MFRQRDKGFAHGCAADSKSFRGVVLTYLLGGPKDKLDDAIAKRLLHPLMKWLVFLLLEDLDW